MGQAPLSDIVSNQSATSPAPSTSGGTASLDDIVSNVSATSPAAPTPDYLTKTEDAIHAGVQGIGDAAGDAWKTANATSSAVLDHPVDTAVGAAKGIWHSLPPVELSDAIKQTLPVIDAYEKARSSGASISDAIKASNDAALQHSANLQQAAQAAAAFKANPTRETARALTKLAAAATMAFEGGELASAGATPAEEAETAARMSAASKPTPTSPLRVNPFLQRIKDKVAATTASPEAAGEAVSGPASEAATAQMRAGVSKVAPTVDAGLRSGIDVQTPFTQAKSLYRTVDEAAKTNFQDLYEKLDVAQDAARQSLAGSPEEAAAQKAVKQLQDTIIDAKEVAKASGVPDVDQMLAQADAKYTETQANKDFNHQFFNNNSVVNGNVVHGDPETINVNNAIKVLENMDRPNKYGLSRLQQTSLGKDGAFKLKQILYDAKKAEAGAQAAGKTAMDARALRNTILKLSGVAAGAGATVAGAAYELTK